jgi:hypothetical protein
MPSGGRRPLSVAPPRWGRPCGEQHEELRLGWAPPHERTSTSPRGGGKASRVPRRALPERVDGLAGATGQVPLWLRVGQGRLFQATRGKLRG